MLPRLCGALVALGALVSPLHADDPAPRQERVPAQPRVVLLRGGLGLFSRGLNVLGERCRAEGMAVSVHAYTNWATLAEQLAREAAKRPLVLIGHSFGADAVLALAGRLESHQIPVDLAVTLESVNTTRVPGNIHTTLNLYSPKVALSRVPLWRGLPLSGNGQIVENINLRERPDIAPAGTSHGNVDDSPQVHEFIIARIRELSGVTTVQRVPAAALAAPRGTGVFVPAPPASYIPSTAHLVAGPTNAETPTFRAAVDQPLLIPGLASAAAQPHAASSDSGYNPAAWVRSPATRNVVGQPTSHRPAEPKALPTR